MIVAGASCPACGHEDSEAPPLSDGVFRCSVCRTRIAFGRVVPRVTLTPGVPDPKFFTVEIDGHEYVLDFQFAFKVAFEILSVMPRTRHLTAALSMLRMYRPDAE